MTVTPGLPFLPGPRASLACSARFTHGLCSGRVSVPVDGVRRELDCSCNCHLERGRAGDR